MKANLLLVLAVASALCLEVSVLEAQTWSAEQQAALAVVERSWADDIAEDATWVDRMSHRELLSWGSSYPVPRDQADSKRWSEYQDDNSNTLIYTISPVGIAVRGAAAVVHYYATVAEENRDGERETTVSRCTDTLTRDGDSWKYLGWFCFAEPSRES